MKKRSPIDAVYSAGVRWIRARDERLRLKKTRNELLCDHERIREDKEGFEQRIGDACWKGHHEQNGYGGSVWVTNRQPGEWCDSCKRRDEVHRQYIAARKRSTSLHSALARACALSAKATDGAKEEKR